MLENLWFDQTKMYVNGEWVWPVHYRQLPLEDPSTGDQIGTIARGEAQDIDAAVAAAQGALDGDWGRMTAAERGRILTRIGQLVLARVDDLARIEALTSASR